MDSLVDRTTESKAFFAYAEIRVNMFGALVFELELKVIIIVSIELGGVLLKKRES